MHREETRMKAIGLRKEGYSYNLISEKISVSKGTLYEWLSDVPYRPNQEVLDRIGKARSVSGLRKHQEKLNSINLAKNKARILVGDVSNRDLFMLGLGIYIGEGTKSGNIVRVINANPMVIKTTIRWFEDCFGLAKENFRLRLHLYPDNDTEDSISFWMNKTGLLRSQFSKVSIDRRLNKKATKNGKLPYGTAHLTVRSNGDKNFGVLLSRTIKALIDQVLW